MSIASEITRLQTAKANLKTSIEAKGVTVPSNATLDSYSGYVDSISGAVSTLYVRDFPTIRFGYSPFTSIPSNISFTGVTNFSRMFTYSNLTSISQGDIDCSSGTNFTSMFDGCGDLVSAAGLNTSNGLLFEYMFAGCYDMTTAPSLDTSSGTDFHGAFSYMTRMTTMPEYDLSSATQITDIINDCTALTNMGGFKDLGEAYLTSRSANYSKYTLNLQGESYSPNNNISYASLMNVINKLYDIATKGCKAQKLVLGSTLMAKLTAEEIAIATNKGWTVS